MSNIVATWWSLFKRRAVQTKDAEKQLRRANTDNELRKCLGPFDLIMLGIGGIIGAGVFVLTGVAANEHAGPAVVISYSVAALAALVSALSYTEFVVDLPTAGGAYNYISLVFGELTAWLVACNLIMEYTLSCAAVARGFSSYLATLAGLDPTFFVLKVSFLNLDFMALALVAVLTSILCYGTKESARFNTIITMINLAVVVFVVCAGMPYAAGSNFKPFAPFGIHGIFSAASVVFFSFIGFDVVATTAEEVKNPSVDLPIGIVGSLVVCAFLYALMCVVICLMVPYNQINVNAPFSEAFRHILTIASNPSTAKKVFLNVASRIVSVGALTGIVTSLLVSLLGQARIYVVLGREALLPAWFSHIHPTRETPIRAAIFTGCTAGTLALLVDINALAQLVSIGTLFVFYMVSAGVLQRRYYEPGSLKIWPLFSRLIASTVLSIAFTISFRLRGPVAVTVILLVAWAAAACTLFMLPVVWRPDKFAVPFSPITPAFGMFATVFLIGSLGWQAFARFGGWLAVSMVVYVLYSMHRAEAKEVRDAHTLVSRQPPPAAATAAEVELMGRARGPASTDAWQDESSSEDETDRGGLLSSTQRSDDPQHLVPENGDGGMVDVPLRADSVTALPGSRAGWARAHRSSMDGPAQPPHPPASEHQQNGAAPPTAAEGRRQLLGKPPR